MCMNIAGFPTSSDIYLELDGKKVAVVQSYACKATRTSTAVEAFGEDEPVATIQGPQNHVIELTRLYATDSAIADGLDFYGSGAPFRRPPRWATGWRKSSPWWRAAASK